jgi:dTDP-glucose 4,6-dehydratase
MSRRVLVTGAAGFIGSHLVEHIFKTTEWDVVALDRLDETSTLRRIGETEAFLRSRDRFDFVWHDLRAPINGTVARQIGEVDVVFHLAASTHVDRSITGPLLFVADNVTGTAHALEYVREHAPMATFLYMNTDEVFGPAPMGVAYAENDRHRPSNPYSAAKSGGGALVTAYHNTYDLDTRMVYVMNAFGERQHPEKYLPLLIRKLLLDEKITIHADASRTVPSSRFYVHARNIAAALLHVVDRGIAGESFNIPGEREVTSLELAEIVAEHLDVRLDYELVDSVANRPGHDLRYALDGRLLFDGLGFRYPLTFDESLRKTVDWYAANRVWLGLE